MKLYVFYIGKPRDPHANALAEEYVARVSRYIHCEMREIQPNRYEPWTRHPSAMTILLDPAGKSLDSAAFAKWIGQAEVEARDLVFVVGGAEGLPPHWRERAHRLLALSPMTYPHELARVMLAEQIYRALALLRGHPYPK